MANDTKLYDEHTCAVQRAHEQGAIQRETKAVAFDNVVDDGTTIAHSAVYGTLPTFVVTTPAGTTKAVSAMDDHYTTNTSEVMRARIKAHAPKLFHLHKKAALRFACQSLPRESAHRFYRIKKGPQLVRALQCCTTTLSTCLTIYLVCFCLSLNV